MVQKLRDLYLQEEDSSGDFFCLSLLTLGRGMLNM